MVSDIKEAIFKTTAYADIFDYPLKTKELWRYLILKKSKKLNFKEFKKASAKLPLGVNFKNNYYFFSKRDVLIKDRERRKKESQIKLAIAQKTANYLSLIPTILLIGVSGNLARMNAAKNDDIDLFFIVKKNTLWLTRLLILTILQFAGNLRRRNDRFVANKICPNLLITEERLSFSKEKQNLYTAYEIAQMKPIFNRNITYERFIISNLWVRKFLPNSLKTKRLRYQESKKKSFNTSLSKYLSMFLTPLEFLAKEIQLWHMKKHITTEKVSNSSLAFHPFDYKNYVQKELEKRLKMRPKPPNTRGY